jgi:hypothetical protein
LIEVAILGVVGFLGIVLEPRQSSGSWGWLVWVACGELLGLSILGELSVSVIVLLAAPALVFGGAAILADLRRGRKILSDIWFLAVSGIANFGLIFVIAAIGK